MFVRKSNYDRVVADRDVLQSQVARLTEQLARANGEITSLKFRLNDVSFRYDQMLKAGEKKATPVVKDREVYVEVVPVARQPRPVYPKSKPDSGVANRAQNTSGRSISRTVRETEVSVDDIAQTSDSFSAAMSIIAEVTEPRYQPSSYSSSYSSSSSSSCRDDSDDRGSSSGSNSCSNDSPTTTDSNYSD
jgi:hypothetical protein